MSQTTQTNLPTRPPALTARIGSWIGSRTTAVDLLLPTGAPLGRPAAMARFDAAHGRDDLVAPARRPRLGRLPG